MKSHRLPLVGILALTGVLLVLVLASCGSSSTSSSTSASSAAPTVAATGPAAMVPDAIKQAGVLKFGTNSDCAPAVYYAPDNETLIGSDIEIGTAIAKVLGLKPEWTSINWDGLRPALESGRFDAVMAEMGDFTDRQAQVTFVDYMKGGICLLVRKADEAKFQKIEDLAGHAIGATKGASTVSVAEKAAEQVKAAGLKPVTVDLFPGEGPGTVALRSGRIDGYVYDWLGGVFRAKTQPAFAMTLPNMLNASYLYGMAVPKTADGQKLAEAAAAALDQIIADGTYQKILDKYGVSQFAMDKASINGGTTSSGK